MKVLHYAVHQLPIYLFIIEQNVFNMKKISMAFLALFSVICGMSQTVDEVINKHTEAMGGKDKLGSLKSVYMESVSVMQNGNEMTSKTYRVDKQLFRRDIDGGMFKFTTIMTDKEGWASDPRNGGSFNPLPAEDVQNQQYTLDLAGPLVDYAAKGEKAELLGKDPVDGKDAFKVKVTMKNGKDITYWLDAQTYYVLKTSTKASGFMRRPGADPNAEVVMMYSDYRKTPEGYVFPYASSIQGMGTSTNVEKIEVNKSVDPKLFKP
jgi:outer membrane lipoprotein-sorting protein